VDVRLEARKGRLVSEARVPAGMLVDSMLLRPHHRGEALLALCSSMACLRLLRRSRLRFARLWAISMATPVEARLEARKGRLISEARVPAGVLEDAMLHRPCHVTEALLAQNSRVACLLSKMHHGLQSHQLQRQGCLTWLWAAAMVDAVQVRLECFEC